MSTADLTLNQRVRVALSREGARAGFPSTPRWFVPVLALVAIWGEVGLYIDGWYHWHYVIDTFFTGPHLIIYSSGLTGVAIFGVVALRNMWRGFPLWRSVPDGYQLSLVGCALFPVGGVSDYIWHAIFGFERILPIWSMSHMLIFFAAALIMSGPVRAAWRSRRTRLTWPETIATGMVLSQLTFSIVYTNPFVDVWATGYKPVSGAVYLEELGTLSILVQAALLTGFVLLLLSRFQLPFGALTLMVGANVALVYLLNFHLWTIPLAIVAGLALDEIRWILKPSAVRPREYRMFAIVFPMVIYFLYFLYLKLTTGVWWEVYVWTGMIVGVGFLGYLLSLLVVPPRSGLVESAAVPDAKER